MIQQHGKKLRRKLAVVTLLVFMFQQFLPQPGYAQFVLEGSVKPVAAPKIQIPQTLGRIEEALGHDQTGPMILHIQNAHGNYEAQKNIQGLLNYLKEAYGFKLVILEGASGKLHPEVFNFFPDDQGLNLKIADELTQKSEFTGAELFLLEHPEMKAYGLEEVSSYRTNRKTFQKVLRSEEKTSSFLEDLDSQIERLTAPYLNHSLKNFLRHIEAYETKKLDLISWLVFLKKEARPRLGVDLEDPYFQKEWPILIRFFRLQRIEQEFNPQAFGQEKTSLLQKLDSLKIDKGLRHTFQSILELPKDKMDERSTLPYLELLKAYQDLVTSLPQDFSFDSFKNVKLYLQLLVIQHEMKGEMLFEEITRLESQLVDKLVRTQTERQLVELFKDYRLLQKLFALELTQSDFQELIQRREDVTPSRMIERFQAVNHDKRVKNVKFSHLKEINTLFNLAFSFYRGAKQRDAVMASNVLNTLKELKETKAVIVTGGFHSQGMKQWFESQGISYFLVSPKITQAADNQAYHLAMLEEGSELKTSQIENVLKLQPLQKMIEEGMNPDHLRLVIAKALTENLDAMKLASVNTRLLQNNYHMEIKGKGETLAVKFLPLQQEDKTRIFHGPLLQGAERSEARQENHEILQQLSKKLSPPMPEEKISMRAAKKFSAQPSRIEQPFISKQLPFHRHQDRGVNRSEVRAAEKHRFRPEIEQLEDRTMPTLPIDSISLHTYLGNPALNLEIAKMELVTAASSTAIPSAYNHYTVTDLAGTDYIIKNADGSATLTPANETSSFKYTNYYGATIYDYLHIGPFSWYYDASSQLVKTFVTLESGQEALLSDSLSIRSGGYYEPQEDLPNFVEINGQFIPLTAKQVGSNPIGWPQYQVSFMTPQLKSDGTDKIHWLSPYDSTQTLSLEYAVSADASLWARFSGSSSYPPSQSKSYIQFTSALGNAIVATGLADNANVTGYRFDSSGTQLFITTDTQIVTINVPPQLYSPPSTEQSQPPALNPDLSYKITTTGTGENRKSLLTITHAAAKVFISYSYAFGSIQNVQLTKNFSVVDLKKGKIQLILNDFTKAGNKGILVSLAGESAAKLGVFPSGNIEVTVTTRDAGTNTLYVVSPAGKILSKTSAANTLSTNFTSSTAPADSSTSISSILPSTTLTTKDITQLPERIQNNETFPGIARVAPSGASAVIAGTARGLILNYNTAAPGWAGGGFTYDHFGTSVIETGDLSGFSQLVFGLKGNPSQVKFEMVTLVDGQEQKTVTYLTGINNAGEQIWVIPTLDLTAEGADLHQVRLMYFIVEGKNQSGSLEINRRPSPPVSIAPSATLTTADITSLGSISGIAELGDASIALSKTTPRGFSTTYTTTLQQPFAGAGFAFDDFTTSAIETTDLSGYSNFIFGIKGTANQVKMEIVTMADGQEKKDYLYMTGIRPGVEQVFSIPASGFSGVDLTQTRIIYFLAEGVNQTGTLEVNRIPTSGASLSVSADRDKVTVTDTNGNVIRQIDYSNKSIYQDRPVQSARLVSIGSQTLLVVDLAIGRIDVFSLNQAEPLKLNHQILMGAQPNAEGNLEVRILDQNLFEALVYIVNSSTLEIVRTETQPFPVVNSSGSDLSQVNVSSALTHPFGLQLAGAQSSGSNTRTFLIENTIIADAKKNEGAGASFDSFASNSPTIETGALPEEFTIGIFSTTDKIRLEVVSVDPVTKVESKGSVVLNVTPFTFQTFKLSRDLFRAQGVDTDHTRVLFALNPTGSMAYTQLYVMPGASPAVQTENADYRVMVLGNAMVVLIPKRPELGRPQFEFLVYRFWEVDSLSATITTMRFLPNSAQPILEATVQGHYRNTPLSGQTHGYLFLSPTDLSHPISTNYLRGIVTPNDQLLITFSEPKISGSLGTSEDEQLISVRNLQTGTTQTYAVDGHQTVFPNQTPEYPSIARTIANDSFAVVSTLHYEAPGIGVGFNRITIVSLTDGSIKTADIPVSTGQNTADLSFKAGSFIDATHAQIDFFNGQSYSIDLIAGTVDLITSQLRSEVRSGEKHRFRPEIEELESRTVPSGYQHSLYLPGTEGYIPNGIATGETRSPYDTYVSSYSVSLSKEQISEPVASTTSTASETQYSIVSVNGGKVIVRDDAGHSLFTADYSNKKVYGENPVDGARLLTIDGQAALIVDLAINRIDVYDVETGHSRHLRGAGVMSARENENRELELISLNPNEVSRRLSIIEPKTLDLLSSKITRFKVIAPSGNDSTKVAVSDELRQSLGDQSIQDAGAFKPGHPQQLWVTGSGVAAFAGKDEGAGVSFDSFSSLSSQIETGNLPETFTVGIFSTGRSARFEVVSVNPATGIETKGSVILTTAPFSFRTYTLKAAWFRAQGVDTGHTRILYVINPESTKAFNQLYVFPSASAVQTRNANYHARVLSDTQIIVLPRRPELGQPQVIDISLYYLGSNVEIKKITFAGDAGNPILKIMFVDGGSASLNVRRAPKPSEPISLSVGSSTPSTSPMNSAALITQQTEGLAGSVSPNSARFPVSTPFAQPNETQIQSAEGLVSPAGVITSSVTTTTPAPNHETQPRSEMRNLEETVEMVGDIFDELIPLQFFIVIGTMALGNAIYDRFFRERILAREREKESAIAFNEQKLAQAETLNGVHDKTKLANLFRAHDDSFALVALPVPSAVSSDGLHKILQDFHPLLMNHPKKPLVLAYAGDLPQDYQQKIYEEFNQRVFVFQGAAQEIFPQFYSGRLSRMTDENQKMAKTLMHKSSEFTGHPVTMHFLKDMSLVASDQEGIFEGGLFDVAKQFVRKPLKISAEDHLSLQLLMLLPIAALENAQLLQRQPEEFQMKSVNKSLRFSFKSEFLEQLKTLVQAARAILVAA